MVLEVGLYGHPEWTALAAEPSPLRLVDPSRSCNVALSTTDQRHLNSSYPDPNPAAHRPFLEQAQAGVGRLLGGAWEEGGTQEGPALLCSHCTQFSGCQRSCRPTWAGSLGQAHLGRLRVMWSPVNPLGAPWFPNLDSLAVLSFWYYQGPPPP